MILCGGYMKELKKENLENMSYKDIANILLESEKNSLNTLELFTRIVDLLELPKSTIDNKIADFYTSLTTDKRFVMIDGKWDLRTRHPSDKVILKVDDEEEENLENNEEEENFENEYEEDEYGDGDTQEDEFDDSDDDLKDLVVLSEEELGEEE